MHSDNFLQDLAVVMCVAALTTVVFRQLKQPVVLGYILAGLVIGPHTPPFELIHDEHSIETLAQLGIIFLMFSLGLEFSLRKLKEVGSTAFIAAALEILLMTLAGYELGRAFGWSQMDSVFLGAMLAISSTTIIIKALEGLGKTKEPFAGLTFGVLIVEDMLAILMLVLLTGFATTGEIRAAETGMTLLKLSSFLGILLVGGLIVVPRLLNYVAKFKSDETLLVSVVGLCFGVALLTNHLGYSVALGAFLIGAIIAEARQIAKIELLMGPVRDLFSAIFFVSIGLLIDPALIVKYAWPIFAITVVVILGKVLSCSLGCFVSGNDRRTSVKVGMSLSQIGEFSFIIAGLGLSLKKGDGSSVTSDFLYPIAVAVSAVTTLMTPYLIRSSDSVVNWFDRIIPQPLTQALDAYTKWVGGLAQSGGAHLERKILSKLIAQIGVNLLLIAGIFISAAFLRTKALSAWPHFPGGEDGVKAVVWLAALLCSFPSLIAVWRKMEVGAMVISEMSVNSTLAGERAPAIQTMISNVITIVGTGALVLLLLLLSSALLPSRNVLILVLVIVVVSGFFLYRGSVKLYAGAQFALHDTFATPADPLPHPHGHHESKALPPLLRHAKLETVELHPAAHPVGKLLSELRLRAETGASVVGIERNGESLINPPPDEELQQGDQVLLIGTEEQLLAAKKLLTSEQAPET